jgi:hypothetical protein
LRPGGLSSYTATLICRYCSFLDKKEFLTTLKEVHFALATA